MVPPPNVFSRANTKSRKVNKNDPRYDEIRRKNNEAIKKTRAKAKQRQEETQQRISELRVENDDLEVKIKQIAHQMNLMRKILEAHKQQQSSVTTHNMKMFQMLEELQDMSKANSN